MKTIRIPDPFPRGKAAQKLEWGSSAWAADSCLVEWSRLEREWLGEPGAVRPAADESNRDFRRAIPGWRSVLVIVGAALLLATTWVLLGA